MMTLRQAREQLDRKECSVEELVVMMQKRIDVTEKHIHSFITQTNVNERTRMIRHAQNEIDHNNQSLLTGIPYAAKDLFCTKGIRTTAGSYILSDYIPPYSATAITRCRDAVLMGKTNMDEFAMGSSTEYSAFGATNNPYDHSRVAGGSSGGSATAVSLGQAFMALGTDTGGSIRLPASFCNVVGLKPTYGRISRYGAIAMASSFDTVGVFTRTVEDAALVLQELAGYDGYDATASERPVDDYCMHLHEDVRGMRCGIPKEWLSLSGIDQSIRTRFEEALKICEDMGMTIVEVDMPHTLASLATYYILVPAEVSSNLARYDGVTYGTPDPTASTLEERFLKTRDTGFGAEAKRRILSGTFCLSSGYIEAYYKKAMRVRTLIKQDFDRVFANVDCLFAPTSPVVPFVKGAHAQNPTNMYASDIFTLPAPLAGVPAISVPAGFVEKLPMGMQFITPQFEEARLLRIAYAFEQSARFPQEEFDHILDGV